MANGRRRAKAGPLGWPGWDEDWAPPTVIVVMAEWFGPVLWNRSPGRQHGHADCGLEPDVLGVSTDLAHRLEVWNDRYGDREIDAPIPDAEGWRVEGLRLAQELQREFDERGLAVEVLYRDEDGRSEGPVRDRPLRPGR